MYADEREYGISYVSEYVQFYSDFYEDIQKTKCNALRLLFSLLSRTELRIVLTQGAEEEDVDRILAREHTGPRFRRDYNILLHINTLLGNNAEVIDEIIKTNPFTAPTIGTTPPGDLLWYYLEVNIVTVTKVI